MSDSSVRLHVESLLEHTSWVRALARRLANDDASADDVEQATWLAALRHRPAEGVPARSWLATIVRNFARQERRASSQRGDHEARGARAEALPSSSDVVERADVSRRLADAVMRLDEPYRTAILLRFFDDLPPREIARRTGQPIATVRTHLARGLERLRASLDREHGGNRAAWISALAPLCWRPSDSATLKLLATTLVNTKLVAAAVVVSLFAVGVWWVTRDSAAPLAPVAEAAAAHAPSEPSAGEPASNVEADDERAAVAATPAAAPATTPPESAVEPAVASRAVRGRVLDALGNPAAAVRLIARGEDAGGSKSELQLTSDVRGDFELADALDAGVIACADPRLSTVMKAHFRAGADQTPPIVVIAPRLDFAGRVVDEAGAALENADVVLELPADFRARFKDVLDRSETLAWTAVSAADGTFALDDVPQIEGARLRARLDNFESHERPEAQHSDLALEIVLARPAATDGMLRGIVVEPSGRAAGGARVALGLDSVKTAADGLFAFNLEQTLALAASEGFDATELVALQPGFLPARFTPPLADGKPAWPSYVTLRLGGEPLAIAGRVIDHAGDPLAGVLVYVADATLFGAVDGRPAMVEGLLARGEGMWSYVETDEIGRFEVVGLLEREYVVRAHDPKTLLRVDAKAVPAGARDVEMRLPTDKLYPRVAGRVVSHGGTPIGGARVFPMCDSFQASAGGRIIATSHDALEGTTTDSEGRFELTNVPKSLVYLRVNGDNILPLEYGRYVEGDSRFGPETVRELPVERIESLELAVELRCHMQVELRDAELADELAVLDESGRELVLSLFEGQGRREQQRHPLSGGRSTVLGVPDTGRTLVLFRDGAEVARMPLILDPETTVVVRP